MKKTRLLKLLALALLAVGLLSLLYPLASNILYEEKQKKIIKEYNKYVENLPPEVAESMLDEAKEYNKQLFDSSADDTSDDAVNGNLAYSELLQVMGKQMGYIVIPAINVDLPIFHYTSDDVLTVGIGHLENSSLPVGGESTHCLLTGHSGLAKAKLFTDLEKLELGDKFYIKTLNEVLCYEVDSILTVQPYDTSALQIIEGRDLVTLITCTPYGINSHRLLVRGTRVEYNEDTDKGVLDDIEASEGLTKEPYAGADSDSATFSRGIWSCIAIGLVCINIAILVLISKRHKKGR